jgi:hypothetical protein
MLQIRRVCTMAAAAIAGLAFANGVRAAVVAADMASNSPYSTSGVGGANNFNGQNGGTGFGPWVVTDSPSPDTNGGEFINGTGTDSHNPEPTFDIYDNGNPNSSSSTGAVLGSSIETVTRPFIIPLTGAGASFSSTETPANLRAINGSTVTSQIGFELLDSSGNVLFNLFSNGTTGGGTGSNWAVIDASNGGNPYQLLSTDVGRSPERALAYNDGSGDTITITLTGQDAVNPNNYDYTISTGGHEGSTFADGGEINMSTGGPAAFAIYDNNGGDGSDIRVNTLSESLVPEPASMALVGLGVSTLLRRRRR